MEIFFRYALPAVVGLVGVGFGYGVLKKSVQEQARRVQNLELQTPEIVMRPDCDEFRGVLNSKLDEIKTEVITLRNKSEKHYGAIQKLSGIIDGLPQRIDRSIESCLNNKSRTKS